HALAYNNRGVAKRKIGNNRGAIIDYNKALEIDPQLTVAYVNRGISQENDGNITGACVDWRQASELGDEMAARWVKETCR
ncbi:MAG TPA: tetratricopeptide repeat protein, partial [Prochlorococcus sp.]